MNYEKIQTVDPGYYYIDFQAAHLARFECKLGVGNWHGFGAKHVLLDLRTVRTGDRDPQGKVFQAQRGIEIGHIFKLQDRYTLPLALVDRLGKPLLMGCYGVGISRLLACVVLHHSTPGRLKLPPALIQYPVLVIFQKEDSLGHSLMLWLQANHIFAQEGIIEKHRPIKTHYHQAYKTGIEYLVVLRSNKANLFVLNSQSDIAVERNLDAITEQLDSLLCDTI